MIALTSPMEWSPTLLVQVLFIKERMDKSMQVQCLLLTENDQAFPTSSSTRARYSVRLSSGEIVIFSAEELDLIMNSRFDCKPPNLPQWLHQDTKVMIYHNNIYLKG